MILGSNMHFFTFMTWNMFKVINTTHGHSGYDFPFIPSDLIPLRTTGEYHDFHHSNNVGNYGGLLTVWDTILGSNYTFFAFTEKLRNKQKKDE